jgi:NTP pyrophosphatase (non-canonical NTP hydrolase)
MEAKLAKNRHKGDRDGWLSDHPWNLVERLLDETVEVQQTFKHSRGGDIWSEDPEKTADECADVANFCMMVADRVTYCPKL